jgi:5'-AMP-activated protein kinase, regulatory gamma subunit
VLTVSGKTSLFEVVVRMEKMRVHRIAVTDDKGVIMAVVTQSSVIAFAATHLIQHVSLTQRVGDTGIGTWPVATVYDTDSTSEAFRKIRGYNLSSVGVVNHDQRLLGSISTGDLRGINEDTFGELKLPAGEFLARRNNSVAANSSSFFTIKATLPIGEIISTLYQRHLHRVFVVDNNLKPLRVITLSDIVALLASS